MHHQQCTFNFECEEACATARAGLDDLGIASAPDGKGNLNVICLADQMENARSVCSGEVAAEEIIEENEEEVQEPGENVTGTFKGVPEGAQVFKVGRKFHIWTAEGEALEDYSKTMVNEWIASQAEEE